MSLPRNDGLAMSPHDQWRLFLWALENELPYFDNGTTPAGVDFCDHDRVGRTDPDNIGAREAALLDLPV